MIHPFHPYIIKNSKSIIIGTLPPEGTSFYYSNSRNTRMWDILKSIQEKSNDIPKGSYELKINEKQDILSSLNLSMADIIYEYTREKESTDDKDIIPIKYLDIKQQIKNTSIVNLLFVYESAARWFLHSLNSNTPAKLSMVAKLPMIKEQKCNKDDVDVFHTFKLNGRTRQCILLPNPLNRGKKGCTLEKKKEIYKKWVLEQS